MAVLLKIIVFDLLISCDNISVIAMATRNLSERKAYLASRFGIGLSLLLKIGFVAVVGILFQIPWLHIRIIGGVMLLYVTFNMLRDSHQEYANDAGGESNDQFVMALISIIAADISMSLDNVLAIVSIVSNNGELSSSEMLLVISGLVISLPFLLWFSDTISTLMQRYRVLTYLCAGYLAYTAVKMIAEDQLIVIFLESVNFTLTGPAAALCGIGVVVSSVYVNGRTTNQKSKRVGLAIVFSVAVLYGLFVTGLISYLSSNPVKHGITLSVELIYRFAPMGANAVFALGQFPELIALCLCFMVGFIMENLGQNNISRKIYIKKLTESVMGMLFFVFLVVAVLTAGLTILFGFGEVNWIKLAVFLGVHLMLYLSYLSVFCMIRTFIRHKAALIMMGMILVHIEMEIVEFLAMIGEWPLFSTYIPGRYLHKISMSAYAIDVDLLVRVALCSMICIVASTWVGLERCTD